MVSVNIDIALANMFETTFRIMREILTDTRNGKEQSFAAAERDLLAASSELSATHKTIVGVIHLIRTLPGGPQNFPQAFKDVYDDFKLFYDVKSFEEERSHCHNIERIYKRISPKLSRLLNRERAYELDTRIRGLTGADFDIIEQVEPWMDEVEKIKLC